MSELTAQKCVACRIGAPKVTETEIAELKPQSQTGRSFPGMGSPDWNGSFPSAISQRPWRSRINSAVWLRKRASSCHPDRVGKVTVSWWTHKIGGLHRNDFIMAAKTDRLFS